MRRVDSENIYLRVIGTLKEFYANLVSLFFSLLSNELSNRLDEWDSHQVSPVTFGELILTTTTTTTLLPFSKYIYKRTENDNGNW